MFFQKHMAFSCAGPTHMISASGGAAVYLGTYDETTEKLNISSNVAQGTGGDGPWGAVGTNGPDPTTDGDRLISTAWCESKTRQVPFRFEKKPDRLPRQARDRRQKTQGKKRVWVSSAGS